MVNSSIFLSRCIFNREPRWKTFFISVEFFTEQKRHRGPWNKCIYAAYSACGMQCVPNRLQITSFVNVRPSLSAPMHFDLCRECLSHRVWCTERLKHGHWASLHNQLPYFPCSLKNRPKYFPPPLSSPLPPFFLHKMGTINSQNLTVQYHLMYGNYAMSV